MDKAKCRMEKWDMDRHSDRQEKDRQKVETDTHHQKKCVGHGNHMKKGVGGGGCADRASDEKGEDRKSWCKIGKR